MIRHVAKLIWNRKRQNALLLAEMISAFLVLAAVTVFAVHVIGNTREPLGFTRAHVWDIDVSRPDGSGSATAAMQTFQNLVVELRQMPQVTAVAGSFTGPYVNATWGSQLSLAGGRRVQYSMNKVTDGFRDVMQLTVVEGRWFSPEDVSASWVPVVVNRRMARELFGSSSAVGKTIDEEPDPIRQQPGHVDAVKRVIGVVDEFRQFGELATPENYMFMRMSLDPASGTGSAAQLSDLPGHLYLRLTPDTTAAFEEVLAKKLAAVAPSWSFNAQSVDAVRERTNRQFVVPIIVFALLAAALLLMVALGLTGVLWQSVTQRTREFGLRRASGATSSSVRGQVLLELATLTTFAVIVGSVIAVQITFLPLPPDVMIVGATFVTGLIVSIAVFYVVTLLCGWYPSRLATRVPPAEALHYE